MKDDKVLEVLKACGYKNKEQVMEEAAKISTQTIAVNVSEILKKNKVHVPRGSAHLGGSFATPVPSLVITHDPNDYDSIQKQYDR